MVDGLYVFIAARRSAYIFRSPELTYHLVDQRPLLANGPVTAARRRFLYLYVPPPVVPLLFDVKTASRRFRQNPFERFHRSQQDGIMSPALFRRPSAS